jgi:hypothetical protein
MSMRKFSAGFSDRCDLLGSVGAFLTRFHRQGIYECRSCPHPFGEPNSNHLTLLSSEHDPEDLSSQTISESRLSALPGLATNRHMLRRVVRKELGVMIKCSYTLIKVGL